MTDKLERLDISSIKDPNVVKTLSYGSLAILCHDIRREILEKVSLYGGHLSSNLGVVELTVALYRVFSFPKDKLIFDVGHQCYTHKILTGRHLDHLDEKGAISGFEKMKESKYDVYEAGHSSTALSAAEGFAIARDLSHLDYNVVAVVGDASIVNGLSFEALNNIGTRKNKVIIILNDNEMSISSPVGAVGKFFRKISTNHVYNAVKRNYQNSLLSRSYVGKKIYSFTYFIKRHIKAALVPTTMFDDMGFTYIGPIDGHNIKAMEKAFHRAETTTKSAIVHVRTLKGKGYAPAEKDKLGYWHGVKPFDIATGKPLDPHEGQTSWSYLFGGRLTHEEMQKHPEAELVIPAMIVGSGMNSCFDDFPSRCIDVGIAEEHAITLSGALSLNGIHPILSIYSTFLQRGYDELLHDCARMNTDMTILIDRAGLVGKNGETHQGIYDEAFLKTIPNVTISMPSTYEEARSLYELSFKKGLGVFAIRYPSSYLTEKEEKDLGADVAYKKWRLRRPLIDNGTALIAVGPLGLELVFNTEKLPLGVYMATFLNEDEEALKALLSQKRIIVYDPYGTEKGFSETIAASLMLKGYKGKLIIKAVPNVFVESASSEDQMNEFHLGTNEMASFLSGLFKK